MAQARYTIFVPKLDMADAGQAVYKYLTDGPIKVEAVHVAPGYPHDAVHVYAEESPQVDSHIKQVATYTAEATGVEYVQAVKEGKSGVATWTMRNKDYQPRTVHEDLSQPSSPQGLSQPGSGPPPA